MKTMLAGWINKQYAITHCLWETEFKYKNTKIEHNWKKICNADTKNIYIAVLTIDRLAFKTSIAGCVEEYFIIIKVSIY